MIPRIVPSTEEDSLPSIPAPKRSTSKSKSKSGRRSSSTDMTDGPAVVPAHLQQPTKITGVGVHAAAGTKRTERAKVKQRDWRASIEAYNQL